jgi:hypothetical protein
VVLEQGENSDDYTRIEFRRKQLRVKMHDKQLWINANDVDDLYNCGAGDIVQCSFSEDFRHRHIDSHEDSWLTAVGVGLVLHELGFSRTQVDSDVLELAQLMCDAWPEIVYGQDLILDCLEKERAFLSSHCIYNKCVTSPKQDMRVYCLSFRKSRSSPSRL